ncbi:hypothetical protein EDD86DRAFT_207756 [Gorgonomyces haynaldii]|nr:hypothetical protein EDD86DRAFT_207756 [Gorgonomyces haynaldii]
MESFLKEKLTLLGDFADHDMVVDFVQLMLQGERDLQEIKQELMEIIEEKEAQQIVDWISEYQSQAQKRKFQVQEVVWDENASKKRKTDLRDRIEQTRSQKFKTSHQDNGRSDRSHNYRSESDRGERSHNYRSDSDRGERSENDRSARRENGQREDLRDRIGEKRQLWSVDKQPVERPEKRVVEDTSQVMCLFGLNCQNANCKYAHPQKDRPRLPLVEPLVPAVPLEDPKSKILCRYYPGCLNTMCPFLHPKEGVPPTQNRPFCRYGVNCRRPGCYYQHPEQKHISERGFAAETADPLQSTQDAQLNVQ